MITGEGKALPFVAPEGDFMPLIFVASFLGALAGTAAGIYLGSWVLF